MLTTLIGAVFVLLIVVGLIYCVRLLLLRILAIIALVWMLTRYGIVQIP